MKKILLLLILILTGSMIIWSQVPQAMTYKAVAKDDWGVALPNKTITLRFTILQGSGTGSTVYQETHSTTTNKFGLMDVEIGKGTPVIGSFDMIDWSSGIYYIQIEMDPNGGTNFRLEDSAHQLLSVPFAFYAGSAGNSSKVYYSDLIGAPILSAVALSGSYSDLTDRPLIFSGNYNDLFNKPTLFSGYYEDLLNKPILFDGTWASLEGKPVLAPVALSGNYSDLTNKPEGIGIGDILYWNGTEWVVLTAGTDGQILTVMGSIPGWGTGSSQDNGLQLINLSPLAVSASKTFLDWECTDPDARPLFFDVYLAGPSGTVKVGSNLITPRVLVTLYEPGTYSWRVCVKDDLDHVTWGSLWQFAVSEEAFEDGIPDEGSDPNDNLEITNPLPLSNVDAELQIAIESPLDGEAVFTKSPVLKWACVEPDMRPLFFDVFFAGPSGTKQIGVNLITPSIKADLNEPGEYSWRVCVKDDLGHVTWGVLWHFIVGVDVFDVDGDGALTTMDCNDHDASIFPGAPEICGDGIDQDCDGSDLVCDPNANWQPGDLWIDPNDGYGYKTVLIGTKTWMAENLRATKYNDGSSIRLIEDADEWALTSLPAYCWYEHDYTTYGSTYGALYKWYTVRTNKLCPNGWHVSNKSEWENMIIQLGGADIAGDKLKEQGIEHWISPNSSATDEIGFTALPGGERNFNGNFMGTSIFGIWWSSEPNGDSGEYYYIDSSNSIVLSGVPFGEYPNDGYSVRCVKD